MALMEAPHRGNVLMIRETPGSQCPSKRKAAKVETSESLDFNNLAPRAVKPGKVAEGSVSPGATETEQSTDMPPSTSSYRSKPRPAKRPWSQIVTNGEIRYSSHMEGRPYLF